MSIANRISHRSLLLAGGATTIGRKADGGILEPRRVAAPGRAPLRGSTSPETDIRCYDGVVPGPEIRVRQNGRVRIVVENKLPQDATIHWHGVRVPNAMDGAPDVTQLSIEPGRSFVYEFTVSDAGTYWYHPHAHSAEQVGRGLAGPFIVEELDPPPVIRDVVWVLGDFRLKNDGSALGRAMITGQTIRLFVLAARNLPPFQRIG